MPLAPGQYYSGSRKGVDEALSAQGGLLAGMANSTNAQRTGEAGTLSSGYGSLLDSGYSPQEKSGIMQGTTGALQQNYSAAADAATRRMARTGNTAGYGSFMGALTRQKGRDLAQQNLDNQKAFADEALRRKMMGLEGIANLYGVDTSFLSGLNSQQNQLIGTSAGVYGMLKNQPSFMKSFTQSVGSGLGNLLTLQ